MEQNNINIADLLKDCPKGTKLYSPICGECELDHININSLVSLYKIFVHKNGGEWSFDDCGRESAYGECLLFPSKEIRDWSYFNVKWARGNAEHWDKLCKLFQDNGCEKMFGMKLKDNHRLYFIDRISRELSYIDADDEDADNIREYILSTGTELKLEDQPKFKVGDVVIYTNEKAIFSAPKFISAVVEKDDGNEYNVTIEEANRPCYKGENVRLATPEEIAKWNEEVLQPNHLHYSKSKRRIVDWFLPFDKVVVRDNFTSWHADLFDQYDKKECEDGRHYYCIGCKCMECLPYNEKTAKLIGTHDEYEKK